MKKVEDIQERGVKERGREKESRKSISYLA